MRCSLERLRSYLPLFCGTHNFHNFTIRKLPTDASARRYIMSITNDQSADGRFLKVNILGQSFLTHQIRKLIGAYLPSLSVE